MLHVRQTLIYVDGEGPRFKDTKTTKGRRIIPFNPLTIQELRTLRKAQLEKRLLAGADYEDHDLVFCKPNGSPVSYNTVDKQRAKRVKRSGVPYIVMHGLRHNHASALIEQGVPVNVVSERLGHARTSITMDIYVQSRPEQQAQAANAFADSIFAEQKEQVRKGLEEVTQKRKIAALVALRNRVLTVFYFGGATQIRTGDKGFADLCLASWLWRHMWSGRRDRQESLIRRYFLTFRASSTPS